MAVLTVSACATASIDDAVPVSANTTVPPAGSTTTAQTALAEPAGSESPAAAPSGAAINTGRFPNLNVTPPGAAPILTPEETASKTAEITAARDALSAKGGTPPVDDQARLRKLASTHAGDTLKQIEGE